MNVASCRCSRLRAECRGEPLRVSVCHCFECQRRTGSVFSAQVRFAADTVKVIGPFQTFERVADSGNTLTYRFCPSCGSTIAYQIDAWPDVIAVPLGAFECHVFPDPAYSIYESRKHQWVYVTGEKTIHHD